MPKLTTLLLLSPLLFLPGEARSNPLPPPGRKPVIVNQAADGIVGYLYRKLNPQPGKGATKDQILPALLKIVDQYQDTGVSHLFWNVNYQRVAFRSAVWPSYWDVSDPEQCVTEWPRGFYELHKLGIDDVFALLIPRSRERGISPWISLRMNDHHYTKDPTRVSPLFFDHPELRTRKGTGLFNYAKPEVREHYLKLVTEVLERYDVDGLELDWIRTPDNFETGELETGREILTRFVRQVRQQTDLAAKRLGHPVCLAVRVPATPEFARGKGFDAVDWAREGLLDLLIPSDWWSGCSDIPVEHWRAQIGAGGKRCLITPFTAGTYACTAKGHSMNRNLAGTRGFTASMLGRGADGIYFFNHFEPVDTVIRYRAPSGKVEKDGTVADLFRAAGSLVDATSHPRIHALTIHDCLPAKCDYRPGLPATVETQKPLPFRIHTGPRPATGKCTIRAGLDKSADLATAKLDVRLNGSPCIALPDLAVPAQTDPRPEQPRSHVCEVAPRILQFEAPLTAFNDGYNQVDLRLTQGAPQILTWLEIEFAP